jgi:O-antigen ligase
MERRDGRAPVGSLLLAAAILVPCLQLIPLPPSLWTAMPGRAGVVEVLRAAGLALHAMPTSLTPGETLHGLLALIPPAALFLITIHLPSAARRGLARLIVFVALVNIFLALLQLAGGADSPLRIYANAGIRSVAGFFANRDHLADFVACAIPLALAAFAAPGGAPEERSRPGILRRLAPLWALTPILIMGVAATSSRAGVVLVVIGLTGGLAGASAFAGRGRGARLGLGLFATVGVVILIALVLGRIPALERFTERGADLRFAAAPTVLAAVKAYWPVGTGVGSFIPIYQTFQPIRLVDPTIFNHAHDDFLEAVLECGLAAVLILLGFLAWFAGRCHAAWRSPEHPGAAALPRAGSLIVVMILIHSAVDYPLRTVAMTSLFAFACALLVPPPGDRSADDADHADVRR